MMSKLKVVVSNKLELEGLTHHQKEELKNICTFPNPSWYAWKKQLEFNPKLRFSVPEPPENIFTFQDGETFTVPTYLLDFITQKYNISEFKDLRVAPVLPKGLLSKNFTYRPGQAEVVQVMLESGHGTFVAPCGSGKTTMALGLVYELGLNALILTHTKLLLTQTAKEIKNKLGYFPGIVGSGKFEIKPITVGLVQTLTRRDLTEYKDYFGAVFADEAQFFAAPTFINVVQAFNAKHKYAMSATPKRADGLDAITDQTIGAIKYSISNKVPQQSGATIKPTFEFIDTPYNPTKQWDVWQLPQHINALVKDSERNRFIVQTIIARSQGNILVLTDRTDHVEYLGKKLKSLNPEIFHGKLKDLEKEEVKKKWEARTAKVTIATVDSLGVGTDVPYWDEVWLVTPTSNVNRLTQIVGRVARSYPGKTSARIYDFRDVKDQVLNKKAKKRMEIYSQL